MNRVGYVWSMAANEVLVQLTCTEMPGLTCGPHSAVRVGMQRGKEVVEDVPGDTEGVVFSFPLRVERHAVSGEPNFLGPYAHGTVQERFLYLCWGERLGPNWNGFRRAKIQLGGLPWDLVEAAMASGEPLKAVVKMTDAKGGPVCATLKPTHLEWEHEVILRG